MLTEQNQNQVLQEILQQMQKRPVRPLHPFVIAIDGWCGSGKSTLAALLQNELDAQQITCCILHMDDYYLQPHQRSPQRYQQPGGNVDRERFLKQILLPLHKGRPLERQVFDCHTMSLGPVSLLEVPQVLIIEGTYCLHPELCQMQEYDLTLFLQAEESTRNERLRRRNSPEAYQMFLSKWIPLETLYFEHLHPQDCADLIL